MTATLITVGVIAIATIVTVVAVRRSDHLQRTLNSVAAAAGTETSDVELVKAVRDLSRRAEESGRMGDAYLAAIDGAPTGIVMLTGSGQVVYANSAAQRFIDQTGDWAILRTRVSSIARQVVSSGETEQVEVDMHDPARLVLLLTAVPIADAEDTAIAVTVHVEDLSARRRVDAMRADFVTNASHELKTPIGALSLLAETLSFTTDESKRVILAEQLASEAARMSNVVDDILTLARTESMTTEYSPVAVAALLDEVATNTRPTAEASGIELVRGDVTDAVVSGDPVELASAFRNLVLNAITYTAAKGASGGTVTYRTDIRDTQICIEVEDTGIGFPTKYERRIFERFFRVDQARGRQSGGTGLGLSIVKNVAVAHGGSVSATSEVGVGSVFTLCLPVASGGGS